MRLRVLLVAVLGLFSSSIAAEAAAIAKVAGLYGSPTANGHVLAVGADVQEHDKIAVETGNIQLIFTDGTKLVVGAHSTLVVEKYLMKGGSQVSDFSVDALRGTFRFITGGSAKAAYDIQTANATIGIRGTGFDFWVDSSTGVVVLEGQVHLCRKGSTACVNIHDHCDAGIADPKNTRKMTATDFNNRAALHLPYIQSQAFLKQPFKLDINSCRSKFAVIENGEGTPPPPRPPRQRGD